MPKKSGRDGGKRSRAVCEGTDTSSALSVDTDTDAILADVIATFRKITPASGVHSIGSFYGTFISSFAHTVICVYRNEDTSLPSKKKQKKASPPRTGKLYRYTFCFGEPRFDADLRALKSDVTENEIAWMNVLAPPIVTGQSTRSPDIALTEDNFVKEWTLWELIQSRDKGEIGRVLRVGGNNGLVFSVKITSWMRSTFQKNFSRNSQSSDSKRYLVFADENNTKYPRSILLLQNNWVLQIECNANCENGTIADMFKGFGIEKLGICFGWSFSSKSNTDVGLFLYRGDKNEASTKAVLKRCRLKLFRVPVAVPGFECLPMDETVILSVTNTDFVEETPLSKPTVEASTSALSLEASQSLALRSANFEGTESAAMGDTLILSDTETPEVGEEHSFSENEPLSMPLVESSTSGFSPLAIVPSTETQAASGSMSVDYALLYYALKDKYNTLLSLYNAHVPMEMTMELPMDVSATDTSASTELSSEFGPAVSDESTDPFSIDALNKGAEE